MQELTRRERQNSKVKDSFMRTRRKDDKKNCACIPLSTAEPILSESIPYDDPSLRKFRGGEEERRSSYGFSVRLDEEEIKRVMFANSAILCIVLLALL